MSERRLDRVCCNDSWLTYWSEISCCTLTRNRSDHYPILLSLSKSEGPHVSSFKFLKMWSEHKDCFDVIANAWKVSVAGCPMFILSQKLKYLKSILKCWNKEHFGNVHDKVYLAEEVVNKIQEHISNAGYSDDLLALEKKAHCDLNQAMHFQELFWQEKSRVNWQLASDRNTSFFHKVTKLKNCSKRMSTLEQDGIILDKSEDIEAHVLDFYTNLFATENSCQENNLIEQVIPHSISREDNLMLTNLPSLVEIKNAVFSMNAKGASGPDGFSGFFFQ